MISISAISISAILLSILLAVVDARGRVEVEVNSSMELAQQLVRDMVKRMTTKAQMEELFNAVPAQLKYVRHARILATNSEGDLVQIAPDEAAKRKLEGRSDQAPRWFTDLVGPSIGTREVRVLLGSNMLGTIVIVSEPGDELGRGMGGGLAPRGHLARDHGDDARAALRRARPPAQSVDRAGRRHA